jgi:hypothetical protein
MTDDDKTIGPGASAPLKAPPAFTKWGDFEGVEVVVDPGGVIPGILCGRHTPSGEWVYLQRAGLSDRLKEEAIERAGVPLRNGTWWVVVVSDALFADKVRAIRRTGKRERDLAGPPGVWMTVEEAAGRTPGGAEKARAWLWAKGLPKDLAGTRFVLTTEWIAALHGASNAVRSSKGGE